VNKNERINRQNYLEVKKYLDYEERVKQCCLETIKRKWAHLRHFLEWAGATRFINAPKLRLTFQNYILDARNDGIKKPLSSSTMNRGCQEVQEFYKWAKMNFPNEYKKVSDKWIDTIRLSKTNRNLQGLEDQKYFTQNEVLRICSYKPQILIDQRDRAAVALLYLSAMRITAFVSLPVRCVDLDAKSVFQFPSEGVITKNKKTSKTILLPIEPLLAIVREWDDLLRKELGVNALWYPKMSTNGLTWGNTEGDTEASRKSFRRGLHKLCKLTGVKYKSSHKLRRGHGVYAAENSENYQDFQAYSQNMGHEDPGTTFKYYSKLCNDSVRAVIWRKK